MTNVTAGAYADMPLFLFHLLDYMDVPYEIDVGEINRRWARSAGEDVWSQLIIKETHPEVELLTAAPKTGVWKLDDRGRVSFARWANDWHNLIDETEAFTSASPPAASTASRAPTSASSSPRPTADDDHQLTERCRQWLDGIKSQFAGTPVAPGEYGGADDAGRVQEVVKPLR